MLCRIAVVGLVAMSLACGTADLDVSSQPSEADELGTALTWNEFLSNTYQEPESGVFVVDGDIPIANFKQLREFYEKYVQSGQLIIHRNGSVDAKWSASQQTNLTYCVSTTFGTRHSQVVQAMADATGAWEQAANVNFVHASAQDSNCTASNSNVLFDVRPVNVNGQYLARAFFPGESRANRNILIDNSAFTSSGDPTVTGVLRHELGHVLGFRHEHTRPEAGTCYEDNSWRVLTSYDAASVMHYPQCNGTGDWTLTLTALDQQGAASVYGAPGGGTTPPPTTGGTAKTQTLNGSVGASAWKHYGPFNVVAGTSFDVTMTGSGDPDLYVRYGAQPTTSAYTCRPYQDGPNEECHLSIPSGTSQVYVSVRGYAAGTFTLNLAWTEPSGGTTPPPSTGTAKSVTFSGSVTQGGSKYHGPLAVMPGTTFKVVMTGSGDPDLYVRFGSQPTTSSFDCRPYLDGPNETCTLTVPSSASSAYIMVRGYTSGTYSLAVNYTEP